MSKQPKKLVTLFGQLWVLSFAIIAVLIIYSILVTSGILLITQQNRQQSFTSNQPDTGKVVITLTFRSKVPTRPITWETNVIQTKVNTTLFIVMNSSLNLTVQDFGSLGVLITGINSILNDGTNFWTYEYFSVDKGWIEAPIGVSFFFLSSTFIFRWTFGQYSG